MKQDHKSGCQCVKINGYFYFHFLSAQILLGPNAAVSGGAGGMMPGIAPVAQPVAR